MIMTAYEYAAQQKGGGQMSLYEYWNDLSAECDEFHEYAWQHYDDLRQAFEQKECRKVLSTNSSWLGIASPSKMSKHIIRKYKSGRVIKNIKPGQIYKATYFDSNDEPAAIEYYNIFPPGHVDDGIPTKGETLYFTEWHGAVWTAQYYENSYGLINKHFKIVYDEQHRLKGFYCMNASHSLQVYAEEYDYSEIASGIVTCIFTDYVGRLSGSSPDIPIGFPGSPAIQWKYAARVDEKGNYTALTTYKNTEGKFVQNEHVEFGKGK